MLLLMLLLKQHLRVKKAIWHLWWEQKQSKTGRKESIDTKGEQEVGKRKIEKNSRKAKIIWFRTDKSRSTWVWWNCWNVTEFSWLWTSGLSSGNSIIPRLKDWWCYWCIVHVPNTIYHQSTFQNPSQEHSVPMMENHLWSQHIIMFDTYQMTI